MIFLSDIPNKLIFPSFFGLLASIPILLYIFLHTLSGYKQHRIKVFLDGILHSNYDREEAYQIYQSLIAFGTGGVLGKGFGNGVQKYNYIPEVETDFAIATYAEETGFIGMILVLFLFFSLFFLIMGVANKSKNYFSKYLVGGIAGYFITQVIINIGVAGSTDDRVKIGDLVIGTEYFYHDFDCTEAGYVMGQIPALRDVKFIADKKLVDISYEKALKVLPENRIFKGIIATGDIFVAKKEIKDRIKENFDSLCCEMESCSIVHTCHLNNVGYLALRSISDNANEEADCDFESFVLESAKVVKSIILDIIEEI